MLQTISKEQGHKGNRCKIINNIIKKLYATNRGYTKGSKGKRCNKPGDRRKETKVTDATNQGREERKQR